MDISFFKNLFSLEVVEYNCSFGKINNFCAKISNGFPFAGVRIDNKFAPEFPN